MKIKTLIATFSAAILPFTACAADNQPYNSFNINNIMVINITIEGKTMTANLVDNSSARALYDKLQQGDVTYTANDYGGFEKVGSFGFSLPRNDQDITTSPGDIILYQGNNLCLYYARNSWDFTPMGKINYQSEAELRDFLKAGRGSITVTLSLPANSGISDIETEMSGDTEYYNLSGVKVDDRAKGVLIAKSKNKTTKIIRK